MRISNAILINELILLLISYFKTSTAFGGGKYFSEYEYPEIQMLFSCKDEPKEKEWRNIGHIQDKRDFSLPVGDENVSLLGRDLVKSHEKSRPWMRGPYVNEVKIDDSETDKENNSLDPSEERSEEAKNIPLVKTLLNTAVDKPFSQLKERSRFSVIPDKKNTRFNENEADVGPESRMHKQIKKTMKTQNREKMIPFNEGNKRIKVMNVNSGLIDDYPNYHRQNGYHEINRGQGINRQFKTKNKVNENIFSGAFKPPEYEGTFQEYEEVANDKNEPVFLNENVPSSSVASNINRLLPKNEGLNLPNEKMGDKNKLVVQANNIPPKPQFLFQPKVSFGMINYKKTDNILDISSITPTFVSPVREIINIIESNVSKANEKVLGNNDMIVQQPNRGSSLNENSQLLAKPPIKIANTLIEKHEDEIENIGVVEQGTQKVKMMTINSITPPVIAERMVMASSRSPVVPIKEHQNTENDNFHLARMDTPYKSKRNIKDSIEDIKEPPNGDAIPSMLLETDISLPQECNNGSPNFKRNVHTDGPSRSSIVNEAHFYSLTQTVSPYTKFSSFISKLKPSLILKKNKDYKDKASGSLKRSVPETYDQEYGAGYDDYVNKDNRKGIPFQAYDYDNQYDLDYENNKDYSRVGRFNNKTGLTHEKEKNDYSDLNNVENDLQNKKRKMKKQNSITVEENYNDVFAHPIALDDPELQIVKSEESEMDNQHLHHRNLGTKRRRVKMVEGKENPPQNQLAKDEEEPEVRGYSNRRHMRKKKGEFALHSHHNKLQNAKNRETFQENEIGNLRNKFQE